ncbi:MAG: hypothetical protein JXA41_12675, partial [Deltaproteobacteria bacterium]|nr:hypothetical protein [Deltaproteobacteria bacterium]
MSLMLILGSSQLAFARTGNGLWITAVTAKGATGAPFDTLEIKFSAAIQAATFTAADIQMTGPGGAIASSAPSQIAVDTYQVTFGGQTAQDIYQLTIGPNILDAGGQPMDQNGDGSTGDAYYGVLFSTAATIGDGDTTYDGKNIVVAVAMVTINGPHNFAGLAVLNGATVNHSATTASDVYKINLTIVDNLVIDAASKIDVTGRGYLAGRTVGNTTTGAAQDFAGGT